MKNEITPQIAALYIGQMATITWLVDGDYFERGEEWNTDIKHSVLEWFVSGKATIRPRLRPLSSLTEAEARELYNLASGMVWDKRTAEPCLSNWWNVMPEIAIPNKYNLIGLPAVWLKLLSWGMDLFGGIESGWAKEVK